jgi:predicted DNA-binding protein
MAEETNKSEILSVRLDPLTKAKLEYICNLEYRPVALQIRKIIEDFIRKYEVEYLFDEDGDRQHEHRLYPLSFADLLTDELPF